MQYFNPSLLEWCGARWLVTRRRRHAQHPGKNDITIWRMRDLNLLDERPIKFIYRRADENWEDPRSINVGGQFILSYCNFLTYAQWVGQGVARINTNLQADTVAPVYGFNGPTLPQNTGWEKNWLWFDHNGELHFVYSTKPHSVVRTSQFQPVETYQTDGFSWKFGPPRGGTPPIYVPEDDLYWSFFHSSLDIHPKIVPRRRYYMGAYAFEPWPPFRVKMATVQPLLRGSEDDPREPSAPLCVFPCGTFLDQGVWTVSFGVNDCACGWIRIPHKDVIRLAFTV